MLGERHFCSKPLASYFVEEPGAGVSPVVVGGAGGGAPRQDGSHLNAYDGMDAIDFPNQPPTTASRPSDSEPKLHG
jgi:hypothetical protein